MNSQNNPNTPQTQKTVCLVGNPNTGKSTLFNGLCGTHQRVGNYPGVTVEKKVGRIPSKNQAIALVDLPGMYSLQADSPDEVISQQVLLGKQEAIGSPDLIVVVVDATNLQRNLFLFSQLLELNTPLLVAVTMVDQLKAKGIQIKFGALTKLLGVPVVPLSGLKSEDIAKLKEAIFRELENSSLPKPERSALPAFYSRYREAVDQNNFSGSCFEFNLQHQSTDSDPNNPTSDWQKEHQQQIQLRHGFARDIVNQVEVRTPTNEPSKTRKIDNILTHRVFGLFFFLAAMFLIFKALYSWSGPFMDGIDWLFGTTGELAGSFLEGTPMLQSLVVDGIIGGVGSVVIFLPQILILFAFVAIMEDSGYLSRVAFLMDKLMSWTGLNGRAFVPMLSGFACAIPAIMATRVMADPKARLITVLITPLMSCSARLPVYVLLISTFIEPNFGVGWAVFSLFAMHALGLFIAIPIAWIFNRSFLKTQAMPFILEMPPYRVPQLRNVGMRSWSAGRKFLIQTGSIIMALSIVVWALSYFPRPDSVRLAVEQDLQTQSSTLQASQLTDQERAEQMANLEAQSEQALATAYLNQSFLARMGKTAQPLFQPLGFDWKITVGVLAAFPAREVIIATMGIIFELGDVDEESPQLKDKLKKDTHANGEPVYTPLLAISLMVFFALCCQCMSTLATIKRELNSWKWPIFTFVYMTGIAYVISLLIYQVGKGLGWA